MPRRPNRTFHPRELGITVFSVTRHNRGFTLICEVCGHTRSWSACELAAVEPPSRTLWEFMFRRKCSMCGAEGGGNALRYKINGRHWPPSEFPTPAQLWAR